MTLPGISKYDAKEKTTETCLNAENEVDTYVCNICEKKFSTKNNLIGHLNCHNFGDNDLDEKNETQNTCNICMKKFTAKKNLLKHLRDVHKNYTEAEKMVVKKIKCPERKCEFLCRMMRELRSHIEKSHKIKILKDILQFPSEAVFQKWKKEEESNTVSWFINGRKKTTLTDGTKRQILYCHRTGHYSPKGFGKYRMRSVGSCKIGVTCPAAMEVTESLENGITVIYYKTHLGHMQDLVYLKLSSEERGHLEDKIKQGFSFDSILDDVKESGDANSEKKKRIHLLSRKDLYNIMYRSKKGGRNWKANKQLKEQGSKGTGIEDHEIVEKNTLVETVKDKIEENPHQNLTFYTSNPSVVSEQAKIVSDNLSLLPQKIVHDEVNILQTATEEMSSQIVILSPDINYSPVAEIILLSASEGAPTEPTVFPQTRVKALEQETYIGELQTPIVCEVASEEKTKVNKSILCNQLREKLQKILEFLPQSEYLTPKQFDLINAKLDTILNIFSVADEKAKAKRKNFRKKEIKVQSTEYYNRINVRQFLNRVLVHTLHLSKPLDGVNGMESTISRI